MAKDPDEQSRADQHLLTQVLPRLVRRADADAADFPAVVDAFGSISVAIVTSQPGHAVTPVDDLALLRVGGLAAALTRARHNLRALPPPEISDLVADKNRDDATVHVLMFDDFFGASRVLNLPEVLAEMGVERPTHGTLIAIPTRQLLLVHVLRGEGVIPAARLLARKSSQFHAEGPARLSPHVFYQRDAGAPEQVTLRSDLGALEYQVTASLREALGALGLLERGP